VVCDYIAPGKQNIKAMEWTYIGAKELKSCLYFVYVFQKSNFVATDVFSRWALIIGSLEVPVIPSVL